MREALAQLPRNLSSHLLLTVLALGLALAIGLPLGILSARRPRLRSIVLGLVGVIQTVPGLALLAVMVPLVAGIGAAVEGLTGGTISALGFLPALLALTLYGLLPIVRNTVTGLRGVDPTILEVARGLGMSPRQSLWRVELPLALPVLVAGVRTAAVWVVGTATLATPVGQRSLGNFLFAGLQTRNWALVAVGCVAAAGLALLIDGLLGLVERAATERRRGLAIVAGAALIGLLVAGIATPALVSKGGSAAPIRVGAKTFTEQYILAELVAGRLERAGLPAEQVAGLGSNFALDALIDGRVDVLIDYSGTIWSTGMKRSGSATRAEVLRDVEAWLDERGVVLLGPLGFENAYALAMRRERAERLGVATIGDLAPHSRGLSFGTDYEFLDRPEWAALVETYELSFERTDSYDPSFLYDAARRGEADVISAYTTDGRIDAFDLVVLRDEAQAIPPYDAVLLVSRRAAADPRVLAALRPLLGSITPEMMRRANRRVDDREAPDAASAARALDAEIARGAAGSFR